jgi:hypothetical protein
MPLSRREFAFRRAALAAVILVVLFLSIRYFKDFLLEVADANLYWLQVITGNWAPDHGKEISKFSFLIGVVVAITFNYAPIVGIGATIWKLTSTERRLIMKINQAYALRDATVMNKIYSGMTEAQVESLAPIVKEAFEQASKEWRDVHVPNVFGRTEAQRFFRIIDSIDTDSLSAG